MKNNVIARDSSQLQISYLSKIKNSLQDSLAANDFSALDFSRVYKSADVQSKNNFLRLYFLQKKSDDFILLKTDSIGNILKARIVHVNQHGDQKANHNITLTVSSLDRKNTVDLKNTVSRIDSVVSQHNNNKSTSSNISSLMAQEQEPVGEQTLPEVVVTGHIYNEPDPIIWYCYDDVLQNSGGGSGGGDIYTYGTSQPKGGGGGGGSENVYPDETINIYYENADQPTIDILKYINCFSLISDNGATFKITICSDIPVNSDPNQLFDFSTGACGHTFLQLTKSDGHTIIQQNIGFYPESGWKSIEANSPVTSKLVDNAGHEFNASLSVNVDAAHFQTALNEIQYYGKLKYDIDNFNCTDFALNVFNASAPLYLDIPQYHIPGGMYGELSNTPQGLYNELKTLSKSGGYDDGEITIPGVAGYAGISHGACN
ncbi:MAG: hypothetical protein ABJB05_11220 [Parafilimonas sp.]